MALFVLSGALCWVQRVVTGFSLSVPVFVFVFLGPGAQLSSLLVRSLFLFWGFEFTILGLVFDLVLGDGCFCCLGELR